MEHKSCSMLAPPSSLVTGSGPGSRLAAGPGKQEQSSCSATEDRGMWTVAGSSLPSPSGPLDLSAVLPAGFAGLCKNPSPASL